jgi:hypothetical protein
MWVLIASVLGIDVLWLWAIGIGVEPASVVYPLLGAGLLGSLSCLYKRRAPPLSYCAEVGAKMILFSLAGGVLTYLAVTLEAPLADAQFVAIDRALGFDWQEWHAWVNGHPLLRTVLNFAYGSTGPQIIFWWLWLSLKGKRDALQEFLWAAIASLLIITPIYALLPAKGPWVFFETGLYADWIQDFLALRDHAMPMLNCRKMVGIVVCPSFHTALGVIFIAIARFNPWLLAGSALLNGAMFLSVPTEGSHYLIDALSGAAVALVSLYIAAWAEHGVFSLRIWMPSVRVTIAQVQAEVHGRIQP